MEVKVSVNGIPRVVCGVTEETTCQEVVLVLAQSLGQPGRYTLREKFKDFERCMSPDERPLETLKKYADQAKEVQLSLQHNGASTSDQEGRAKFGRYEPCPPLRRKDIGPKKRRSSGSLSLHRQSLPPLSTLREEAEQKKDNLKAPKRKSLTLMEEAWEWLENLGKGKVYSTVCDRQGKKRTDKKGRASLDLSLFVTKDHSVESSRGRDGVQNISMSEQDHQTTCCIGNQVKEKDKRSKKTRDMKSVLSSYCAAGREDEKNRLTDSIICQLLCLQDLQVQIKDTDKQIFDLEQKQTARRAEEEARERSVAEEIEEITFWESGLKAEESYEKDLQRQFLDMRAMAAECKAQLEEYKRRMQGFNFLGNLNISQEDAGLALRCHENVASKPCNSSKKEENLGGSESHVDENVNRKFLPKQDHGTPHALVPPNQIKERRPTGPNELKEWWKQWSAAQKAPSLDVKKGIHRSELTIYLKSTKV